MPDWNTKVIEEFRANEGRVGGPFQGAPVLLLHTKGRRTGEERVNPMMYLPEGGRMFVFASKGGAPTNPDWYYNLVAAGQATVEVGASTFPVTITEITGEERDRVFAEQVKLMPGFADYLKKTEGIRIIPVLHLTRQ